MAPYRCPVCGKLLSHKEYEAALGILGAREEHLKAEKDRMREQLRSAKRAATNARAAGVKFERDRTQRLLAGKDEHISELREQLKRLKKGTTPQTDGLEFEDKLFAKLSHEFASDELEHDGKGGDILHTVVVNGKHAGLILYECKRCRRIESDHINQAARDKRTRQADFAILVTTGTRRGFTGLSHEGPVLMVSPLGVVALARLVRAQLIEMSRARLTASQREKVAIGALEYLTGPAFRGPLEDAIAKTHSARLSLEREVKSHITAWKQRWTLYETIDLDLASIVENTGRVIHGGKPSPMGRIKPTTLQLPAGENH